MKAVILSAKKKDSLFPFCETKPTGMMPVGGEPLVKRMINQLQGAGVEDVYIVANHLEEQFEEEFNEYTNVNILHQEELTGTAEAVNTANFIEDDFIVINGDVVVEDQDIEKLINRHKSNKATATVLATDQEKPEKFGVLRIKNDEIIEVQEKPEEPESPLINTGIYVYDPVIFDYIEDLGEDETSITDALNSLLEHYRARFELAERNWIDIGSVRKLLEADLQVRNSYEGYIDEEADISSKATVSDTAVIREGAEVKSGAVIEGSSYIGRNVTVGPNATVRESTITYNGLLDSCVIDTSLMFERNIVDPNTSIEKCVIGENSDIKASTVIRESFIGSESFIEMNNSIYGTKFVPEARTDLSEISK